MKSRKKLWITLGCIGGLLVILIIAAVLIWNANKEKIAGWYVNRAFTKTIHDFPGHHIENLDENEETNFIVYAKDVKIISASEQVNVISYVDQNALEYTITHPDEQITSLKKGDVFFIAPSANYALGLSAKVAEIDFQQDQVHITGESFKEEELIEYIEIDMDMPVSQMYFLSEDESADIEVTGIDEIQPLPELTDEELQQGLETLKNGERIWEQEELDSLAEENQENSLLDEIWDLMVYDIDLPLPGYSASTGVTFNMGKIQASGSFNIQVSKIHVIFKFIPSIGAFYSNLEGNIRSSLNATLAAVLKSSTPKKQIIRFVWPIAGPVVLQGSYFPTFDLSGSVGASFSVSNEVHVNNGFISPFRGVIIPTGVSAEVVDQTFKYSLLELKGKVGINVLDATMELGIPFFAGLNTRMKGGLEISGTLQHPKLSDEIHVNVDSVHDCEACVDGKCDWFIRVDSSAAVGNEGEEEDEDEEEALVSFTWNIVNLKFPLPSPLNTFYISFKEGGEVEFDHGKCPNRRWRTDITVVKKGSEEAIPYVSVDATHEDGRSHNGVSDEYGNLKLYLPAGVNTLEGEADGLRGEIQEEIKEKPTKVTLPLGGSGDIHFVYKQTESDPVIDSADTNSWDELKVQLEDLYMKAIWHYDTTPEDLCASGEVVPGDIILDVTYDAPHTSYDYWMDDYPDDGDLSNCWGEPGGWIFIGGYRVYQEQGSDNLHPHMTFGLSVAYDPARKAYYKNVVSSPEPYEIRAFQDVSPQYNKDYMLLGYGGIKEGAQTWYDNTIYIETRYTTDLQTIQSIPSERRNLPRYVVQYLPLFVGGMIDQQDLDQVIVMWE